MKKIYYLIFAIIIAFFNTKIHCFDDLSLIEKWNILLKCSSPYWDCQNFDSQFQLLEYLRCFKTEINGDLSLLDTIDEIKQYAKFVKHMSEFTTEYYDINTRDFSRNKLYVQRLHCSQWSYWYSLKIIRT